MMFPWGEAVPLHQSFPQSAYYNQEDSYQITKKSKVIPYQENFGEFLVTDFGIPNKARCQLPRFSNSCPSENRVDLIRPICKMKIS